MDAAKLICQSCSMPLTEQDFGTEQDGSVNKEYCIHCYKNGSFTHQNATLDEMVDLYAPQWGSWTGRPELSLQEAKIEIKDKLSPLKRWSKPNKRTCCCGHKNS